MSRTEENIAKVRQILRENRRLTVRSIAEQVNIDRETVREILTEDLDMRKVCAKMGPKGPAHTALSVREILTSKQVCRNTLHIHRL
jgi:predicted transcriptional regulator